jgi:hypothetical protein
MCPKRRISRPAQKSLRPSSFTPHRPSAISELDHLSQPSHKYTIKPEQSEIEQITASTLEPEGGAPALQQIQTLSGVVDDFGTDKQVQVERGDEGEVCA